MVFLNSFRRVAVSGTVLILDRIFVMKAYVDRFLILVCAVEAQKTGRVAFAKSEDRVNNRLGGICGVQISHMCRKPHNACQA